MKNPSDKVCAALTNAFSLLLLSTIIQHPSSVQAQGTAFTYQGRLTDNGGLATGYYDILFSLYDAPTGGSQVDGTLVGTALPVTNGLFTVSLDFGPGIFTGPGRWLKLDVRTNNVGPYFPLSPRQAITATPYAITASNLTGNLPAAQVSGTLALAQLPGAVVTNNASSVNLTGAFNGNGAGVSNVNALTLGGLGAANFWKTAGNAGTTPGTHFLGTTDNQPLEFKVHGQRAFRIEPNTNGAPNMIGGSISNCVGAGIVGATIAGGGATNYHGFASSNTVLADFGAIGGGDQNSIASADAQGATIAGGNYNYIGAAGEGGVIGGGDENYVGATDATIAGGYRNSVGAFAAAIGGGFGNIIGDSSGSAIVCGLNNWVGDNSRYSTIGGGQGNSIADSSSGFGSQYVVIAGGLGGSIGTNSSFTAIAGGDNNSILAGSDHSSIGGGSQNSIGTNSSYCLIAGGYTNNIAANSGSATIAGGELNGIGANAYDSTIGGGEGNSIADDSFGAIIAGGRVNLIGVNSFEAVIAGGGGNQIYTNCRQSTIGGGVANSILPNSEVAVIAGGQGNTIATHALFAAIGGGNANGIGATAATIAGGWQNGIATNSDMSAIGGGFLNIIPESSRYATIPGGRLNVATNYAFAAGTQAKAIHSGALVWGDSTAADIASTNANSVTMRAAGGYRLFSDTTATAGVFLAPGGTSWAVISDRNAKKDFAPVDTQEVLEKLAALPITQWHYKWEEQEATAHIGPMAQDFKAAFYPGSDDKSITTQEADGVALAAIQGLNQKLSEELKQKGTEITELKEAVNELKQLVSKLTAQQNGGVK